MWMVLGIISCGSGDTDTHRQSVSIDSETMMLMNGQDYNLMLSMKIFIFKLRTLCSVEQMAARHGPECQVTVWTKVESGFLLNESSCSEKRRNNNTSTSIKFEWTRQERKANRRSAAMLFSRDSIHFMLYRETRMRERWKFVSFLLIHFEFLWHFLFTRHMKILNIKFNILRRSSSGCSSVV